MSSIKKKYCSSINLKLKYQIATREYSNNYMKTKQLHITKIL